MSMFGYGTPKNDLYEAVIEHAKSVGDKGRALTDLMDVVRAYVEYELPEIDGVEP
jgi:hypothetical protein